MSNGEKTDRLGNHVSIKTGKLDANSSSEDGIYPFFTCSREPLSISSYSYDCECVLIAGNGDLNVKYYKGKFDAYQRTYIIESLNKNKLQTKFLYYFMEKNIGKLRDLSIGGIIKYIKLGNLTELSIPLFDFNKQQQIATTLDKASELIALRKKQLEELDALAESMFYDTFGDPVKNEKGWDVDILKNFGKVSTGNTPSREEKKYYNDSYIEWIKSDNIMDEYMLLSQAKEYLSEEGSLKGRIAESGSILMTCIAGSLKSIGTVGVADRDVAFNQQINAIYPCKKVEKLYLYSMLKHSKRHIQSYASNGMKHLLNKSTLESIYFPYPPLSLQTRFASIIEKIEEQKALAKKALQESEDLFQRLMQDLFKPD